MMKRRKFLTAFVPGLAVATLAAKPAHAAWTYTGAGIKTQTLAFITLNLYSIAHYVSQLPVAKNKQAVIDANQSKRFSWTQLRDRSVSKIKEELANGFALNNYTDQAKIDLFLSAFGSTPNSELLDGKHVTIEYHPAAFIVPSHVSIVVEGKGNAFIAGYDFMRAVWSIWLGVSNQPALGNQLISALP
jgi:hypothetical protein